MRVNERNPEISLDFIKISKNKVDFENPYDINVKRHADIVLPAP